MTCWNWIMGRSGRIWNDFVSKSYLFI